MSRTLARDCGFKMVFQILFNIDSKVENLFEEYKFNEEEKNFSSDLFFAVKNNIDFLNKKIEDNLKNLSLKDIYKLDLAILLVCVAEIEILKSPLSLSINEAVRLAKKYSTDKSPSFINGVLSSIYKN